MVVWQGSPHLQDLALGDPTNTKKPNKLESKEESDRKELLKSKRDRVG